MRLIIIERDLKMRTRLLYFDAIEKNAISSRAFPASGQFKDVESREGHLWGSQNEAEFYVFPLDQRGKKSRVCREAVCVLSLRENIHP